MKYYIIAGEASGDIYGADLITAIKKKDKDSEFRCWGGDLIKSKVGSLAMHYEKISFMGIYQVLINILLVIRMFRFCKRDIKSFSPDVIILIDYPGFNLRIAKYVKKNHNIKVFYYISPQVWAWKSSRVKVIDKYVDKMFVILPFEKDFYKSKGVEVDFVGHPLVAIIEDFINKNNPKNIQKQSSKTILLLMPGSRKGEIKNILPTMLLGVEHLCKDYRIILSAKIHYKYLYEKILSKSSIKNDVDIVYDRSYDLMNKARLSLVASGTATLENALFSIPQVICYKMDRLSYLIASMFIDVGRVSLVNIIMKEDFIKELVQAKMTKYSIKKYLDIIINDIKARERILLKYKLLKEKIKLNNVADNVADKIIKYTKT